MPAKHSELSAVGTVLVLVAMVAMLVGQVLSPPATTSSPSPNDLAELEDGEVCLEDNAGDPSRCPR
jgi:hypothetical protein